MILIFNINPVNRKTLGIQFSGTNAYHFYSILKTQEFHWKIFNLNDLSLGRIDISFIRSQKIIKKLDLLNFFEKSAQKFKKHYSSLYPQRINTSLGLGTRTGDYFLRIYKSADDSLKFELEIKKYKSKQLTPFLISNSFVELENSIAESFFRYLKIALVFDTDYTDWLLVKLRDTNKPNNCLVSNYLKKNSITRSISDKANFYRILQFLSVTRNWNFKQDILNGELYYTFNFPLVDFAKQIDLHPLDNYNRKKLLQFFNQLQKFTPIYQCFTDFEFRNSLIFPVIRIENRTSNHTKIMIHITVSESFYKIRYPFYFTKTFNNFGNTYDLKLKTAIIESISHEVSSRKILYIEPLFDRLNNKNKTAMKNNLIQQFQHLINEGFIHNEFHLLQKDNQMIQVNKLTIELINSTKQLIFYENI